MEFLSKIFKPKQPKVDEQGLMNIAATIFVRAHERCAMPFEVIEYDTPQFTKEGEPIGRYRITVERIC